MSVRDDLARVVAERRAANPRNEPGHVDYGISDAVLGVVRQAIREQREALAAAMDVAMFGGVGPAYSYGLADEALDVVLALFPKEHQQ